MVKAQKYRGRLRTVFDDIYYKKAMLKINPTSIDFFDKCNFSNAFHRVCYKTKVAKMFKQEVIVEHLKGISFDLFKKEH